MSTQIMLLYISCSPLTRCTDTSFCFQSLFSRVRSRSLPRAASNAATHPPPSHSEVHSESSLQLLEKSWTEKQTNASITDQKEIVVSDTWPDLRWTTARPVLGNNLGSSWRQYFFKFLSRSSLQTSIPSLQRRTPEEQGQPGARLTQSHVRHLKEVRKLQVPQQGQAKIPQCPISAISSEELLHSKLSSLQILFHFAWNQFLPRNPSVSGFKGFLPAN